jgi:hypothetical protein
MVSWPKQKSRVFTASPSWVTKANFQFVFYLICTFQEDTEKKQKMNDSTKDSWSLMQLTAAAVKCCTQHRDTLPLQTETDYVVKNSLHK